MENRTNDKQNVIEELTDFSELKKMPERIVFFLFFSLVLCYLLIYFYNELDKFLFPIIVIILVCAVIFYFIKFSSKLTRWDYFINLFDDFYNENSFYFKLDNEKELPWIYIEWKRKIISIQNGFKNKLLINILINFLGFFIVTNQGTLKIDELFMFNNSNNFNESTKQINNNINNKNDTLLYSKSLQYASYIFGLPQTNQLVSIQNNNLNEYNKVIIKDTTYITVYTFTNGNYYNDRIDEKTATTRLVWIFTKDDFLNKFKCFNGEDTLYRINQLMGFPPNKKIDKIVEIKVKPEDLIRPCLDKEINDCECNLNTKKADGGILDYYIQEHYKASFNNKSIFDNYPFTMLGYTFDWNPYSMNHIGVSEFVIKPASIIIPFHMYSVKDFFKKR